MIIFYYLLFISLKILSTDSISIGSKTAKNDLVPYLSSRLDSLRKDSNSLKIVSNEPFIIQLQVPENNTNKDRKEKLKEKKKRPSKKRHPKLKPLRKKHRIRRDAASKSSFKQEPSTIKFYKGDMTIDDTINSTQKEIFEAVTDLINQEKEENKAKEIKNLKKNEGKKWSDRLKHRKDESAHRTADRHSMMKMPYQSMPKLDSQKYTHEDLILDRERLEEKINYVKNLLNVNGSDDDGVRVRRRTESDRVANKIAKMFLTLSAVNGLHDRKRSKCREEDDNESDAWGTEIKTSPSRKTYSNNEERYKVKKWIEHLKSKRSGRTCPCMANEFGEDNDIFPLEQKLTKGTLQFIGDQSSEESMEVIRDGNSRYYIPPKSVKTNFALKNNEAGHKFNLYTKRGRRKLELPIEDLEVYRSRAKQILRNAEEILDKIKEEEEKRLSTSNILMSHLKELTSRIQPDPRNNENNLIRMLQKNIDWGTQPEVQQDKGENKFIDNLKAFILDPYEKAKALTDESTRQLSTYLLKNLGNLGDYSEDTETSNMNEDIQSDPQIYQGQEPQKGDVILSANLEKEVLNSENRTDLQSQTSKKDRFSSSEDVLKKRVEEILKEQKDKLKKIENDPEHSENIKKTEVPITENVLEVTKDSESEFFSPLYETEKVIQHPDDQKNLQDNLESKTFVQSKNENEGENEDSGRDNEESAESESARKSTETNNENTEDAKNGSSFTGKEELLESAKDITQHSTMTSKNFTLLKNLEVQKSMNASSNADQGIEKMEEVMKFNDYQSENEHQKKPENNHFAEKLLPSARIFEQQKEKTQKVLEVNHSPVIDKSKDVTEESLNAKNDQTSQEVPFESQIFTGDNDRNKNDVLASKYLLNEDKNQNEPITEVSNDEKKITINENMEKKDSIDTENSREDGNYDSLKPDSHENFQQENVLKETNGAIKNDDLLKTSDSQVTNSDKDEILKKNIKEQEVDSSEAKTSNEDVSPEEENPILSENLKKTQDSIEDILQLAEKNNENSNSELNQNNFGNSEKNSEPIFSENKPQIPHEENYETANSSEESGEILKEKSIGKEDDPNASEEIQKVEISNENDEFSSREANLQKTMEKDEILDEEKPVKDANEETDQETMKAGSEESGTEDIQIPLSAEHSDEVVNNEGDSILKAVNSIQDLNEKEENSNKDVEKTSLEAADSDEKLPTKEKIFRESDEGNQGAFLKADNPAQEFSNKRSENDLESSDTGESNEHSTDLANIPTYDDLSNSKDDDNSAPLKTEHPKTNEDLKKETKQNSFFSDVDSHEESLDKNENNKENKFETFFTTTESNEIRQQITKGKDDSSKSAESNNMIGDSKKYISKSRNDDSDSINKDSVKTKKLNDDDENLSKSNEDDSTLGEVFTERDKNLKENQHLKENNDSQTSSEAIVQKEKGIQSSTAKENFIESNTLQPFSEIINKPEEKEIAEDLTSETFSKSAEESSELTEIENLKNEEKILKESNHSEKNPKFITQIKNENDIQEEQRETTSNEKNDEEQNFNGTNENLYQSESKEQSKTNNGETLMKSAEDTYIQNENHPKEDDNNSLQAAENSDEQKELKTENFVEDKEAFLRTSNPYAEFGASEENQESQQSNEETKPDNFLDSDKSDVEILSSKIPTKQNSKETLPLASHQMVENELDNDPKSKNFKINKLQMPKTIEKIMEDLEGNNRDDLSMQNLDPEKLDHFIDKIDEAERQNLQNKEVDCRKECACAEELNVRSRNIGRYEIVKDFLHWMKDLQINRVLSDD